MGMHAKNQLAPPLKRLGHGETNTASEYADLHQTRAVRRDRWRAPSWLGQK